MKNNLSHTKKLRSAAPKCPKVSITVSTTHKCVHPVRFPLVKRIPFILTVITELKKIFFYHHC